MCTSWAPCTGLITDFEQPFADLKAVDGILNKLLFLSPKRQLLYVSTLINDIPTRHFDHLACFLPGLLALGADTLDLSDHERELHMWAAEGLAHSCWTMYADQFSGVAPESVLFDRWPSRDWREGLWMRHVRKWKRNGRRGGAPPGVRNAPLQHLVGDRDYISRPMFYYLRPEVS